jgi:hypothetical protein
VTASAASDLSVASSADVIRDADVVQSNRDTEGYDRDTWSRSTSSTVGPGKGVVATRVRDITDMGFPHYGWMGG